MFVFEKQTGDNILRCISLVPLIDPSLGVNVLVTDAILDIRLFLRVINSMIGSQCMTELLPFVPQKVLLWVFRH